MTFLQTPVSSCGGQPAASRVGTQSFQCEHLTSMMLCSCLCTLVSVVFEEHTFKGLTCLKVQGSLQTGHPCCELITAFHLSWIVWREELRGTAIWLQGVPALIFYQHLILEQGDCIFKA